MRKPKQSPMEKLESATTETLLVQLVQARKGLVGVCGDLEIYALVDGDSEHTTKLALGLIALIDFARFQLLKDKS